VQSVVESFTLTNWSVFELSLWLFFFVFFFKSKLFHLFFYGILRFKSNL